MDWTGIASVLRVNGKLPRRAVLLPDGALGDKVQHPTVPEVDVLSRLCEITRASTGQPSWPRRTAELLELALTTNAPGAWEAARDDIVTSDLDLDAAAAVLRQGPNSAALVSCLVGSRNANHMLHIGAVLSRVLSVLSEESRVDVGHALACQLRGVMDVFVVHGALLSRDVRDAVLGGFARMLAAVSVPDAHVADLVLYALAQRRDELLRLFLHVPTTFVTHKPQILPDLLDRARKAPAHARYPAVALLARLVVADTTIVVGFERELMDVAAAAISCPVVDARSCVAAATLAMVATDKASPEHALARALHSCSAAVVRARQL